MNAKLHSVLTRVRAAPAWLWSHRTKALGGIGTAAGYAYVNQDKLGLFIPAARLGATMMVIGVLTFGVGLYNTFLRKDAQLS
jgi:hypothetical protein